MRCLGSHRFQHWQYGGRVRGGLENRFWHSTYFRKHRTRDSSDKWDRMCYIFCSRCIASVPKSFQTFKIQSWSLLGHFEVDLKVINARKPYTVLKALRCLGIALKSLLNHFEVDLKVINASKPFTVWAFSLVLRSMPSLAFIILKGKLTADLKVLATGGGFCFLVL